MERRMESKSFVNFMLRPQGITSSKGSKTCLSIHFKALPQTQVYMHKGRQFPETGRKSLLKKCGMAYGGYAAPLEISLYMYALQYKQDMTTTFIRYTTLLTDTVISRYLMCFTSLRFEILTHPRLSLRSLIRHHSIRFESYSLWGLGDYTYILRKQDTKHPKMNERNT
uniref:Uncharacterized protein n=1 Tax=Glossina pallidipes TaxID=7398 RepID=A0A1A9Z3Z8_GLOPL